MIVLERNRRALGVLFKASIGVLVVGVAVSILSEYRRGERRSNHVQEILTHGSTQDQAEAFKANTIVLTCPNTKTGKPDIKTAMDVPVDLSIMNYMIEMRSIRPGKVIPCQLTSIYPG